MAMNFTTEEADCALLVALICDESISAQSPVSTPLVTASDCLYTTTVSSSQFCPVHTVRPYNVWLVDFKHIMGGVLISLGALVGLLGRLSQATTNFVICSLVLFTGLMWVFVSTFLLEQTEQWLYVVTTSATTVVGVVFGVICVTWMRLGSAVVMAVAGALVAILLNNAIMY